MTLKKVGLSVLAGLLALLLALTMFDGLAFVEAEAKTSYYEVEQAKKELQKLKDQKKDLSTEMSVLKKEISANASEIEKMVAEKNLIDQQIGILNMQMLNLGEQINAYGLLIADKQDELDAAQKRLEELRAQNKARIRAMEEQGKLSYWSVLFRANSFSDLLDRLQMIKEIAAADVRRMEEMTEATAKVEEAQLALESEMDALEDAKEELEVAQTELEVKRVEASTILARLNAKGEEFDALMDDAEERQSQLMKEIAAAEKDYNQKKNQYDKENRPPASSGDGKKPPASVTNGITWVMPCNYIMLTSPYGWRIHPTKGTRRFHHGVDLGGRSGTPIYATRSGTVTAAKYASDAGYYVTVNHGDGFSSSYLHMTHFVVFQGDKVKAGQVIGYMGSTGDSTGPHLHFAIYYDGTSQNPADYINFY